MPIKQSAKKEKRVSERRRVINVRTLRDMRSNIKEYKKNEGKTSLSAVQKAVDKACKRGVIKKNRAARIKSRLVSSTTKA